MPATPQPTPGSASTDSRRQSIGHCRQVRERSAAAPWCQGSGLSLGLIHPRPGPFTGVRGPLVRAGQGRSWAVVNGGVQYSKACEGASLPSVQIPPPPPLTCKNTVIGSRQAGFSRSRGLISRPNYEQRRGPAARISRSCYAWSPAPRTHLNEDTHAAKRARYRSGLAGTVRDRPDARQPTDRITLMREVPEERAPSRRSVRPPRSAARPSVSRRTGLDLRGSRSLIGACCRRGRL
jgi:hypothetical protein